MNKEIESVDVSIKWPFKWTLVGSSGSGKTNFALNIIKKSASLFDQKPDRVIIMYKVFQEIYNDFDDYYPTSLYTEEECNIEELTKSNTERLLIICDDLYFSKKLDEISEHFLIKGRHRNTSWIVLTQSIFNQPALKNISRNSTHMTLFKNVRLNEPHILFSQLRPRASKVLQNIYADATKEPYGYLDIDLSQTCPDKLRYKTNLFDSAVKVFVIMNDTSFKTMYLVNKSFLDQNQNFKLSIKNKDICSAGMNVTVKPLKQRKYRQENEHKEKYDVDDDNENDKYDALAEDGHSSNIPSNSTIGPNWPQPNFKQTAYLGSSNLKRKNDDFYGPLEKTTKRTKITRYTSPLTGNARKKTKSKYRLSKYQNRLRKRRLNGLSTAQPQANDQGGEYTQHKFDNGEQPTDIESESRSITDENEEHSFQRVDRNLPENQGDVTLKEHNQRNDQRTENLYKEPVDQRIQKGVKRQKIEDESDDQWMSGLKSRLNERRVQFKRKEDTIGYRVLPDDESKSIIKPTDFKFLDPVTSGELLGKWKSLKELKRKQPGIKRLKPHRSFAIWKEPNN
jgi:hypothetical protein